MDKGAAGHFFADELFISTADSEAVAWAPAHRFAPAPGNTPVGLSPPYATRRRHAGLTGRERPACYHHARAPPHGVAPCPPKSTAAA